MKQIVLIFICASIFGVTNAQVSYGVKGGLNLSKDFGQRASDSKIKEGFHLGVFAGFPFAEKLSIQPEFMYSAQGSKYSNGGDLDSSSNLNYLNLPVMVKYTTASGFYGETGPQVGFLMTLNTSSIYDNPSFYDNANKADFSWAFGIGYKSASNVGIDLRYNLGLTSLYENSYSKVYRSVLQLGLFYVLKSK